MSLERGGESSFSETGPSSFQMPYIQQMFDEAQSLFEQGGPSYYSGPTVAGFTPNQESGFSMLTDTAQNFLPQFNEQLQSAFQSFMGEPGQNPYLQEMIDASTRPLYQNLTEQILPQIRTEAAGVGTYGGSRQSLSQAQAAERTQRAAGDISSQLAYETFSDDLNRKLQAMGFAPMIQEMSLLPGQIMEGVGAQQREYDQDVIDEAMKRHEYYANLPYQNLANFAQYVSMPFGSESANTMEYPDMSSAEALLGGASGIANLLAAVAALKNSWSQ